MIYYMEDINWVQTKQVLRLLIKQRRMTMNQILSSIIKNKNEHQMNY